MTKQVEIGDGEVGTVGRVVQLPKAKLFHLGTTASGSMRTRVVPDDEGLLTHDAALAQNGCVKTVELVHDVFGVDRLTLR